LELLVVLVQKLVFKILLDLFHNLFTLVHIWHPLSIYENGANTLFSVQIEVEKTTALKVIIESHLDYIQENRLFVLAMDFKKLFKDVHNYQHLYQAYLKLLAQTLEFYCLPPSNMNKFFEDKTLIDPKQMFCDLPLWISQNFGFGGLLVVHDNIDYTYPILQDEDWNFNSIWRLLAIYPKVAILATGQNPLLMLKSVLPQFGVSSIDVTRKGVKAVSLPIITRENIERENFKENPEIIDSGYPGHIISKKWELRRLIWEQLHEDFEKILVEILYFDSRFLPPCRNLRLFLAGILRMRNGSSEDGWRHFFSSVSLAEAGLFNKKGECISPIFLEILLEFVTQHRQNLIDLVHSKLGRKSEHNFDQFRPYSPASTPHLDSTIILNFITKLEK